MLRVNLAMLEVFNKSTDSTGDYENTPIQFHHQKLKVSDKNSDIFHISAQNIDCGYPLEPHRQGGSNDGSNEYPQPMYLNRNKKK